MTFRIRSIEAFHPGKQIIIWLEDETSGSSRMPNGGEWCVRLTIDEAPQAIAALNAAYTNTVQSVMIDVAAGGCRICENTRRVNRTLIDLDGTSGDPCSVCIPRAEQRIRKSTQIRRRPE
jgi:hypothetical protein